MWFTLVGQLRAPTQGVDISWRVNQKNIFNENPPKTRFLVPIKLFWVQIFGQMLIEILGGNSTILFLPKWIYFISVKVRPFCFCLFFNHHFLSTDRQQFSFNDFLPFSLSLSLSLSLSKQPIFSIMMKYIKFVKIKTKRSKSHFFPN